MKNVFNFTLMTIMGVFLLWSCTKDPFADKGSSIDEEGVSTVTLDFRFEGLNNALATRGVNGNLDFAIENLVVLFYEATDENDPEDFAPKYVYKFKQGDDNFVCEKEQRNLPPDNSVHCEAETYHGLATIDVPNGSYRIYAAANVENELEEFRTATGKEFPSEKELREITIKWDAYTTPEKEDDNPLSYKIPNAMFGYFNTNTEDHIDEKYRNVIHHNTTKGIYPREDPKWDYDNSPSLARDHIDENRAPIVTLNNKNLTIHAWLKRVVSKLTIGFDGNSLKRGVEIYIKRVSIHNVAATCFLGHDNSVGELNDVENTPVKSYEEQTEPDDQRLNIIYSTDEGATGDAITRDTPAYPRSYDTMKTDTSIDGETRTWNSEWYDYVHGNTTYPNPMHNGKPITLYFMENLQGVAEESPKISKNSPAYDGKPDGTYVEVKAYYKNTNLGKATKGEITYRFMLGKDIYRDFNAERNCHYKLILSFVGDANNPDWHIEYEEEKEEQLPYFRIPYNQDYDIADLGFTDQPNNEKWNDNENWKLSNVWYAFDDDDEPIAEVVKEIVYWSSDDPNYTLGFDTSIIEAGVPRTYYQIVTVYPVVKNGSDFTTDYSKGIIAQVLACDSQSETNLPKANGKVHMLKRTEPNTTHTKPASRQWRGYYVIKSLNWGTDGDEQVYNYVYPSETRNEDGYYDLTLGLSPKTKRLTTGAYRIKDVDNNSYPIVKIGTSYWMRESLKTTHYSNNTSAPIDAWDSSKTYTKGGPEDGPNEPGWVYFDERWPLYKDLENVRLYNFFALTGTKAKDDNYGEGRTYDYCSENYEVAGDPMFEEMYGDVYALLQPEYLDYEYQSEPNLQITPKGWHIPITYAAGGDGFYGEHWDDNLYIEEFIGNNWGRALKNSTKWPSIDYQINKFNLSDLCIDPIPSTWEANENTITFDVNIVSGLNKSNNIDGVVVPFWGHLMQTEKQNEQILWWYANPTFLTIDTENYNSTLVSKQSYGESEKIVDYCKLVNKCYLPVRGVRHAYDYKVPKKEGDEEHYIVAMSK